MLPQPWQLAAVPWYTGRSVRLNGLRCILPLEPAGGRAHLIAMPHAIFRRVLTLIVTLAVLASVHSAGAPSARAEAVVVATAGQLNPGVCKGCGSHEMAADECLAVCGSVSTPLHETSAATLTRNSSWWSRVTEKVPTVAVQPDLSPPRV